MSIVQFIKNPQIWEIPNISFRSKISRTIFYRLATLSFVLIISIFLNYLMAQNGITDKQNMLYDFFNQNSRLYVFLSAVIIWPIVEELVFRSFLKPRLWIMYLRVIWIIYIVAKRYIYNLSLANDLHWFSDILSYVGKSEYVTYIYIWAVLFILCIVWLLYLITKYRLSIYNFVSKYFSIFFRLSCLIFGLVHITNFSEFVAPWYVYILMVIPQLTIAVFLWFVRTRFGLWYSMFYHILHNWFLSFAILYAKFSWVDIQNLWSDIGIQNPTFVMILFLWILSMIIFFVLWVINIVKIIKQQD